MPEQCAADNGILGNHSQERIIKHLRYGLFRHHFTGQDQITVQPVDDQVRTRPVLLFNDLGRPFGAADRNIIRGNDQHNIIHTGLENSAQAAFNAGGAIYEDILIPIPERADQFPEFLSREGFYPFELSCRKQMKRRDLFAGEDCLIRQAIAP